MRLRVVALVALVLATVPGGRAAIAEDTPYRGLADYRTVGGKYTYAPAVVVPAAEAALEPAPPGSVHRLRVRSLAFVTAAGAPRAKEVLATLSEVVLGIERPAEPPELRARFEEDLARIAKAPCAVMLGLRAGDANVPYALVLDKQGLGSAVFTPPPAELQAWMDAAATYARLGQAKTLDARLWGEVRAIGVPEIRFQALLDVLVASYRGALRRQPIGTRVGLVREIIQAMGSELTPERWLRLHVAADAWDRHDGMLQATLGGAGSRWLEAAGASDDRVADFALAVAALPHAQAEAGPRALEIVGAFLGRGKPLDAPALRAATRVLELGSGEGQPIEPRALAALLRGLSLAEPRATESQAREAYWSLVVLAAERMPAVREALRSSPEADARSIRSALQDARLESGGPAALVELRRLIGTR